MTKRQALKRKLKNLGISWHEIPIESEYQATQWYNWCSDNGMKYAPFTSRLGIVYDKLIIVSNDETPLAHIIHEAAHLVASPHEPYKSNELDFLGWEYAISKKLGIVNQFIAYNQEYGINWTDPETQAFVESFGDFKAGRMRQRFLRLMLARAKECGCVDAKDNPVVHPERAEILKRSKA